MGVVLAMGLVLLLQPSQGPFSAPLLIPPNINHSNGNSNSNIIVPDKATLPGGDARITGGDAPLPPPPPLPPSDPFRPSIAVIIAILTTMLSLSFLVFLFARHCRRRPISHYDAAASASSDRFYAGGPPPLSFHLDHYYDTFYFHDSSGGDAAGRTDSGLDQRLLEALPIFPFFALNGRKQGLECAVCLSKYDASDILRLLPACNHAFHVDCVDLWLLRHSTCPLCRRQVSAASASAASFCRRRLDDFLSSSLAAPLPPSAAAAESGSWRFVPMSVDSDSRRSVDAAPPPAVVADGDSRRFFPTLLDIMMADSASRRFAAGRANSASWRTLSGISTAAAAAAAAAMPDRGQRLEFYVQREAGEDVVGPAEGGAGSGFCCPCGSSWRSNDEAAKAAAAVASSRVATSARFVAAKTGTASGIPAAIGAAAPPSLRPMFFGRSQRMTRPEEGDDTWANAAVQQAWTKGEAEQRKLALAAAAAQRRRRSGGVAGGWRRNGGEMYCDYYGEEVLRRLSHRIDVVAVAEEGGGGGGGASTTDGEVGGGVARRCMSEIPGLQRTADTDDHDDDDVEVGVAYVAPFLEEDVANDEEVRGTSKS